MVKVIKTNWISEEALEAELIISDGKFELLCFSHPSTLKENEEFTKCIYIIEPNNIIKSFDKTFEIEKLDGFFEYSLNCLLENKAIGLLKLGEIRLKIESNLIPNDIIDGEYISFVCERLDC